MRVRGQAETFEQRVGAFRHALSAQPVVARRVDQHVAQREVSIEVVLLGRKPDELPRLPPLALVVVAEDANAARALARQPDDRVDRRRFPRAVGAEKAEEPENPAPCDSQRDTVDGREASVPLDEPIDLDCYGISFFNCLYRWRRRVAMSSALSGIPQSLNWVATFFTSKATRRCLTSQPPVRSVKIA